MVGDDQGVAVVGVLDPVEQALFGQQAFNEGVIGFAVLDGQAARRALRVGQGLVGRIAERAEPFATNDAQNAPGFRYLPETGEERYTSFVGVPIQRIGEVMGVIVVQN